VALAAGEKTDVTFTLEAAAFESVNSQGESVLEPGEYLVTAAAAAPFPLAEKRGAPPPVSARLTVR